MVKRAAFLILLLTAVFTGSNVRAHDSKITAIEIVAQKAVSSHFEIVIIGDKTYLIEYNDSDGSIISIIEIDE